MECYREKRRTVDPTATNKICTVCKNDKVLSNFSRSVNMRDGRHNECKDCMADRRHTNKEKYYLVEIEWRNNNKDHVRQYAKEYYHNNKEKCKEYTTTEDRKRRGREWRKQNPGKCVFYRMARYNKQNQSTPLWSEKNDIIELYEKCSTITKTTGIEHNVDHIVPLNGKKVCGLHCIDNLQIITKIENIKKSNKHHSDNF